MDSIKPYKGFLDEAIKLGAEARSVQITVPNKETYKIKDNYISVGCELSFEFGLPKDGDIDSIVDALDAYVLVKVEQSLRTQKAAKGIIVIEAQANTPATVAQMDTVAGFGPPAGESLASEPESHSEPEKAVPVEVVKFTLARRTDGKYDLGLFQMYGQKVGQYPELKYTAEQGPMWQMIGRLVENLSFDVMPVEYEVSWLAEWAYGREYTKKDDTKGRYKDLVGLKQR